MTKKTKVLLVVPSLVAGGQERVAVNTANILAQDYDITLAVFTKNNAVFHPNCRVLDLHIPSSKGYWQKIINVFRRIIALKKLKHKLNIDISISFGNTANMANVLSKTEDRAIISIRGYYSLRFKTPLFKIVDRVIYNMADKIICVSEKMASDMISLYHIPKDKVFTLYNPYDIDSLSKQAIQPITTAFGHPAIVAMGSLEKVKGYNHLLSAFAHVQREIPEANLVFIGDGRARDALKKRVDKLGLSNSITFLGFQSNPFCYLARCDMFVLPSINEGFPNALVEAMACGLPVIATDCKTGPREILTETFLDEVVSGIKQVEYGLLVTPFTDDDSDEPELDRNLADAMLRFLRDDQIRRYYRERSLQRARHFSVDTYRNNISAIMGHKL